VPTVTSCPVSFVRFRAPLQVHKSTRKGADTQLWWILSGSILPAAEEAASERVGGFVP
jgi:hypothetical protein